jgi:murein DD-endopeptidase MepM/ murein hydrolase activator NlpD
MTSALEFWNILKEKMKLLKFEESFAKRYLNEGFSGGEKKKCEILQLAALSPKIALLDETDSGLDIDANYGQHVVATADGVVTKASWHTNYGKTVIVKHKDNYETLYGHLSELKVKEGQEVKGGDVIGRAGSTGRSTGTHLHYEVIKDGERVNPTNFLSLK